MQVTEVTDRESFLALQPEWDALVASTDDQIFYRHDFIRIWIEGFEPEAQLRVLVGRGETGELEAVLPLVQERTHVFGAPVVQLSSTSNAHSCRFDLIAREPEAAGCAFFEHLRRSKGWHVLRLVDVPDEGRAWGMLGAARRSGYPTGTWSSIQSPYVVLPHTGQEFAASINGRFRSFLKRRRQKLVDRGEVTVEHLAGGPELTAHLKEGYALEESGWKGRAGTAIAQAEDTTRFYTELAKFAQREDHLSLHFLRLNGAAVAFQYGLEYNGTYCLLKPAYDESVPEASPGQLLMEEVLKYCVQNGLKEYDFLGPEAMWKRKWTHHMRGHTWLFVFRNNAYGRLLCSYKFKWVPAARKGIERVIGTERLAAHLPDDGTSREAT